VVVAINVIQVKPMGRSNGRSATAAAAYRSGETIECEREQKTHDYSKKTGILKKDNAIILPTGTDATWVKDRSTLWNTAEAAEKRKDGRVAREYVIALPKEATHSERKQLAYDFAQYLADRYSIAVDVNIHQPHRTTDGHNDNYHAHLLTTTRQITPDGLGQKSDIELSDSDRFKLGLLKGKDEVFVLREQWTDLQNKVLEKYGVQVSALSLSDQGLDQEPTLHMGAEATHLERQGELTTIGDYNRAIVARNEMRRLDNPLTLEQEIIATESILAKMELEQNPIAIEPAKSTFDLDAIRAQGKARFNQLNDERKAELAKQEALKKEQLMRDARERGQQAEAQLKQQRIERLFSEFGEVVEQRKNQQQGYTDTSLLWRTLNSDARGFIDDVNDRGMDALQQFLGTPSEPILFKNMQYVLTHHDEVSQQLTTQGRLHDEAIPRSPQKAELKAEKPKDRDNDHGMSR
jgi:hypothetical protein